MARRRFYESSSGDTWDLVREDERVLVRHTPNLASGGRAMDVELATFMAREPHVAQAVALVDLIGTLVDESRQVEPVLGH